jgi:uncharacterized CHY-type Zn-finger protein
MLLAAGPDKFSVVTYLSQFFHHFKDKGDPIPLRTDDASSAKQEEEIRKRKEQMENEYRKRAKKCAKCGDPISGTAIEALNNTWHQKCFVCTTCDKPFQDSKFVNVDGKPYCQNCGRKAFASSVKKGNKPDILVDSNPICGKCGEPCSGDAVEAIGKSFHSKCFTCEGCDKPFAGKKFLNVENKPYCEQCGKKAFVSRRRKSPSSGDLISNSNASAESPDEGDNRNLVRSKSAMLSRPAQEVSIQSKEAPASTVVWFYNIRK